MHTEQQQHARIFYELLGTGSFEIRLIQELATGCIVNTQEAFESALDEAVTYKAGIYCTFNPSNKQPAGWSSRHLTRDKDIGLVRFILVDLDAIRAADAPSGACSTDDEHQAVLDAAEVIQADLAKSEIHSIRLSSGNGAYLLIRADLPTESTLPKRFLQALAVKYNSKAVKVDTSTHNPARVMRIPGTFQNKKVTDDRPQRPCGFLEMPNDTVTATEALEAFIGEPQPEQPETTETVYPRLWGYPVRKEFFQKLSISNPTETEGGILYNLDICPKCNESEGRPYLYCAQHGETTYIQTLGCHRANKCALKATGIEAAKILNPEYVESHDTKAIKRRQQDETACDYFEIWLNETGNNVVMFDDGEPHLFRYVSGVYRPTSLRSLNGLLIQFSVDTRYDIYNKDVLGMFVSRHMLPAAPEEGQDLRTGEIADHRIACRNGLVDLQAAAKGNPAIQQHNPRYFITRLLDVAYVPADYATTDFQRYLDSSLPNRDCQKTFQQLLGSALSPVPKNQYVGIMRGPTAAGKSLIVKLIQATFGADAIGAVSNASHLADARLRATLHGKLYGIVPEIGSNSDAVIVNAIKAFSGGDPLDYDVKYVKKTTTAKHPLLIFQTNDPWVASDESRALHRRLVFVSFPRSFTEHDVEATRKNDPQGRTLDERLVLDEINREALFYWLVQGWIELFNSTAIYRSPKSVELLEDTKTAGSPIATFLSEVCEIEPDAHIEVSQLYEHFKSSPYFNDCTKSQFTTAVESSFPDVRVKFLGDSPRKRHFVGITLTN